MIDRRTVFVLVSPILMLAATASDGLAGEECRTIHAASGPVTYLDAGQCPRYDGPRSEELDHPNLPCIKMKVAGTLSGTWYFYWPFSPPDHNCVSIAAEAMVGGVWRDGTSLVACYGLGVFDTRQGKIYTESSGHTHSDAVVPYAYAWASFDLIRGGTGAYRNATGWIGAFNDEVNGGPVGGLLCGVPARPHGKGRK